MKSAAIIAIFLFFAFSNSPFVHGDNIKRYEFLWWRDGTIRNQLKLTPEQVEKIEDIFRSYRDKKQILRRQLYEEEEKLRAASQSSEASVEELLKLTDRVETTKVELRMMKIDMLYQIRSVLTPQQRRKLRKIRNEMQRKRRKKQSEHYRSFSGGSYS